MKDLFVYAIRKSSGKTFCITQAEALKSSDTWEIIKYLQLEELKEEKVLEELVIEEAQVVDYSIGQVTEILEEISIPIKRKGRPKKG